MMILTADQKYPLFIKARKEAATKTLPEKKRKQRNKVSWEEDTVVQAINKVECGAQAVQ